MIAKINFKNPKIAKKKKIPRHHFSLIKLAKTFNTQHWLTWWARNFHVLQEYKLVWPFWKAIWQSVLRTLNCTYALTQQISFKEFPLWKWSTILAKIYIQGCFLQHYHSPRWEAIYMSTKSRINKFWYIYKLDY